ncbi:ABC transporter permease [Streptomyces sp. AK08-02]|uniref:ABC transporter permease n=1 Tax=Streptomyces sp. AK08-02 TaxID=3028654 RepID=UPI0029BBDF35|nr:ABC transporter permease [Streptomyces sp. AK08-02]MDX3748129.1 ABC transporter permease [Streptomyces sp. AK08-02]
MNAQAITTEPAVSGTTDDGTGGPTSLWDATRSFRPALAVLCVLFVVLSLANADFRTVGNLENVAVSVSILWMIALGATFVQLTGGIDLSSGAVAALAGICLAKLLATTVPGPLVIALVILFGAAVGALANGILVGVLGLNVFVVTLASMTALTGIVSLWSDTQSVYVTSQTVTRLSSGRLLGAPVPVWLMLLTLAVFLFLQTRTYFGRDLYAVGGSPVAARLSGIRAPRTLVVVYALAGAMAALGGIIAVGRVGAAAPQPDNSLPLSAIAAVLLGGTALAGGAGGVGGTALGVLLIGVLQNGLSLSDVPTFWQQVVTGAVLVLAVLGDRGYAPRGLVARLCRHRPRVGSPA